MPSAKIFDASSYILIGGLSRRFGSPKWKANVNNVRIIDHLWDVCKDFQSCHIIGKTKPEGVTYPFLQDQLDVQSPIIGLLTALNHSDKDWIFLISCDLPLMTSETIQSIRTLGDQSADAIVPLVNDFKQPICAFYHKRILENVQSMVSKNELRLKNILDEIQSDYVVMDAFEKEFTNMNTVEDLERILEIL